MFEPDIKIAVCNGGYAVSLAQWVDGDDGPLRGSNHVCASITEVLRLVAGYIEAADTHGPGVERVRRDVEGLMGGPNV